MPDLQAAVPWMVPADPEEQVLDARFLDASDLRLLRMGITFRHRTGEGSADGRWTLKVPVPSEGVELDRLEIEVDGPPGPPPDHLASAVRGVLRGADLTEVARLQTNRTVVAIRDPADRPLGLLSDDVVSAFDGDEVGWRFREIEVEAAEAAPANVIDAVVDVLRAAAPVSRTTCPSWPVRSDPVRWRRATPTSRPWTSTPRSGPRSRTPWPPPCGGSCSTIPSSGWTPATRGCTRPGWPRGGCAATCARSERSSTRRSWRR